MSTERVSDGAWAEYVTGTPELKRRQRREFDAGFEAGQQAPVQMETSEWLERMRVDVREAVEAVQARMKVTRWNRLTTEELRAVIHTAVLEGYVTGQFRDASYDLTKTIPAPPQA